MESIRKSLLTLLAFASITIQLGAQTVLSHTPATTSDMFGRASDVDGDRLVIGAAAYDPGTPERTNAGAAFVFVKQAGTWTQEAMLLGSGASTDAADNLGQSVAISGTRVVAGAYNAERFTPSTLSFAGAAYVFTRDAGTGTWSRTELVPSDAQANVNYGYSVDIDGDTIIVGAYNFDISVAQNNAGAAYVFQFDGTNWIEQAKLLAPAADQVSMHRFGYAVAIDGDVAIVGAYGAAGTSGRAYAFHRTGATWSAPVTLPQSVTQANGGFGRSVALDLPHAVVGASSWTSSTNGGAAFFYRYDSGTATWSETALRVAPSLESLAYFGFSSAVSGEWALVGARADDVSGLDSAGSVSVYHWNGTTWDYDRTLTSPTPATSGNFGGSVGYDGVTAVIGEYLKTSFRGSAVVYDDIAAQPADVSVVKTLTTSAPFVEGQSLSYTIQVANAGPEAATSVLVTDTPSNLTIGTVSGGGCAALPCTIPSIASGGSVTIDVTATIAAPGAFDNTVSVSAAEPDANLANNSDATGNGGTAAAVADLSLAKMLVTPGPWTHGQSVTYTIGIANAGPSAATSVLVTDTPLNLTIDSVTGAGCTSLPCTIPALAAGANATITLQATIAAPGAFDNGATALAVEVDGTPAIDASGNGGTAAASADLAIVKTLTTSGPFVHGQTLAYTIAVTNLGPSDASSVLVADTPQNLTITNVTGDCAALPCTIPALAAGASISIDVDATIDAPGPFDNAATVSSAVPDPASGNDTDATDNGGIAAASADLSIVKTLTTSAPFHAGSPVTYTLAVANAGPSDATSVTVADTPSNLTIDSVTGAGCTALPCTIPTLAAGAAASITVTAIPNEGPFDNTATLSAAEDDPVPANNTDASGNGGVAAAAADVAMVKTLTTAGPYLEGQSIAYTLVVTNSGPSDATSVAVTDTPSNLTITGVSGACAALPCTIPALAAGADATIAVTATIATAAPFDNAASASAAEHDPAAANNTDATGNGGSVGFAELSISKTLLSPGPFLPGQTVSWTIVVSNAGPATATTVTIDDLPSNVALTAIDGGGCTAFPCTVAALAAGASLTVDVSGQIGDAGPFDNGATVTAVESDSNSADNADMTGNGGHAAPAAAIPTAGTTALLLLAAVLAVGGAIALRG